MKTIRNIFSKLKAKKSPPTAPKVAVTLEDRSPTVNMLKPEKKANPETKTTEGQKRPKATITANLALIISILAIVPGIVTVAKWFEDGPKFKFSAPYEGNMEFDGGGPHSMRHYSGILLTGVIYNDGNEPLYPIDYELRVKYNDIDTLRKYQPTDLRYFVKKGVIFNDSSGVLLDTSIFKNIWEARVIRPKETQWVYLFFITESPNRTTDKIQKQTLFCRDVIYKDRSAEINIDTRLRKGGYIFNPLNGQFVKEKE